MVVGDTSKVDFKRMIRGQDSFYQFSLEIYQAWRGELKNHNFPEKANMNETQARKLYSKINKIYDPICGKLEKDFWERKKKDLEDDFTSQGVPFKKISKKLKKRGGWNSTYYRMDPDEYENIEEETREFKKAWNDIMFNQKEILASAKGKLRERTDQRQRINSVLNVYLTKNWESNTPKGEFGDGSDESVKEKCANCKINGPDDYETKWISWETNKVRTTGIEIPWYCSQNCLYQWLKKSYPNGEYTYKNTNPEMNFKSFSMCTACGKVSKKNEFLAGLVGWKKSRSLGIFCSQNCLHEAKNGGGLKQNYIQKIRDLGKLTEKEKDYFISLINNSQPGEFAKILRQAEEKNWSRGESSLSAEIKKAIREIEVELNQEPKIEWEKNSSFEENWKDYLENSSSLSELKTRKEKLLNIIQTARKKQGGNDGLTELRLCAIHLIKRELEKNSISGSELTNPNWENDINQAQSESAIEDIKNQILADIQSKRVVKEKNRLNELLIQAKENWNNYQNLENILKQIKELRSSNAYQEKEAEIQALENRLQELDPSQYKKTSNELLDQQIKNNGLTDSNMDEETKKAIAEAKRNPTPENRAKAEEKICQNGANNNLSNLITSLKNKLKKGNLTKEEKEAAINEIMRFIITENKYQRDAYKLKRHEVDSLLAELKGEKENQEGVPLTKIIFITALITLPLIIVFILILRVRRRRLRN